MGEADACNLKYIGYAINTPHGWCLEVPRLGIAIRAMRRTEAERLLADAVRGMLRKHNIKIELEFFDDQNFHIWTREPASLSDLSVRVNTQDGAHEW